MAKLVCSQCGGTKFIESGWEVVFTVYIPNGTAPYQKGYRCSNCGHEEIVNYPAVYFDPPKPFEVELPESKETGTVLDNFIHVDTETDLTVNATATMTGPIEVEIAKGE